MTSRPHRIFLKSVFVILWFSQNRVNFRTRKRIWRRTGFQSNEKKRKSDITAGESCLLDIYIIHQRLLVLLYISYLPLHIYIYIIRARKRWTNWFNECGGTGTSFNRAQAKMKKVIQVKMESWVRLFDWNRILGNYFVAGYLWRVL